MKIAIYHNLPSGGGKRALYEMTCRLKDHHDLDVYTLSCAEHDFADLRTNCNHHYVYPFNSLPLAKRPLGRINQLIRTIDLYRLNKVEQSISIKIDRAGYDIIFVHNCQFGQSPSLLRLLKSPTVYYCGEPIRSLCDPEINRPYINISNWKRRINKFDPLLGLYHKVLAENDRKNVLHATVVLTNSAFSRENLYRVYGIFARICYLGVDTERFQPLHIPKESFVLSVGAVRPNKGFDFLLHSLSYVNERQRPRLVIVTNFVIPEERKYLEELSNQLGVKLDFQVLIPEEQLAQTYNQAILTLYAPILEPFGFVPIESMACGTPVVAINEGGVRESVQNRCTGLLTERDPQEFAGAVAELLKDKGRRTAFGAAGRDHVVENWRWERCITEIEKNLRLAAQH